MKRDIRDFAREAQNRYPVLAEKQEERVMYRLIDRDVERYSSYFYKQSNKQWQPFLHIF